MSRWVRSPAQGRASTPRPANSRTRSATPTAFRSQAMILAPACPNASATALPICPARPTPVTRATLPPKSNRVEFMGPRSGRSWRRGGGEVGAEPVEALEPFHGHFLGSERAVALAGLGIAVPVAPAGAEQAQPEGDIGQAGPHVGVVAGVPGLDRIEALVLQPLYEGTGAPILQVRHRDEPTHGMNQLRYLTERGQHLLDERRTPAADVPVEGLRHAECPAATDDRPRHVRSADRAAARLAQHVVEVERHAHAPQPVHHGARAPHAIG